MNDLQNVRSAIGEMNKLTLLIFTELFKLVWLIKNSDEYNVLKFIITSSIRMSPQCELQLDRFSFLRILRDGDLLNNFEDVTNCAIDDILVSIMQGKL